MSKLIRQRVSEWSHFRKAAFKSVDTAFCSQIIATIWQIWYKLQCGLCCSENEVKIHGLGAAINRAVNMALQLKLKANGSLLVWHIFPSCLSVTIAHSYFLSNLCTKVTPSHSSGKRFREKKDEIYSFLAKYQHQMQLIQMKFLDRAMSIIPFLIHSWKQQHQRLTW